MSNLSASEWILSVIITWVIGLLPPLLIRFALLRRPLDKYPAIGTVGAFLILNIVIFTALGSENKSHAVLLLISYISYWILRREKTDQRVSESPPTAIAPDNLLQEQAVNHKTTPSRRIGWLFGIVVIAILMALTGEIVKQVTRSRMNKHESAREDAEINSLMVKMSKEINSQLPMMVDPETRFESTLVIGKQLNYKYTFVNSRVADINKILLHGNLEAALKNNLCSNEQMKMLMSQGVEYRYLYSDMQGYLVDTISINASTCQQ